MHFSNNFILWIIIQLFFVNVFGELSYDLPTLDKINAIKGGVLVKHNKQSFCNLAIIDNKAAVVSANCLSSGSFDNLIPSDYSVFLDGGIDGEEANYPVESITIHPHFDSETLANNIAVLQYNSKSADIKWQNKLALANRYSMTYGYQVYNSLKSIDPVEWEVPFFSVYDLATVDVCSALSPMYAANENAYLCSNRNFNLNSFALTCPIPYTIVYAIFDHEIYIVGLYSFTAIYGSSNLCLYKQQRSYYTMLALYTGYLKQVINRNITLVYEQTSFLHQEAKESSKNPDFTMNTTSKAMDPQVSIITGDLYINKAIDGASSTDSASNEPESNGATSQDTYATNSVDSSSQNGSSSKAGIIAGACIGAAGLIIISGAIYYIRWKRKKSPGVADPMRNNDFQNMLEASRPGRTTVGDYDIHTIADYDLPPVYEEVASHPLPPVGNRQSQ